MTRQICSIKAEDVSTERACQPLAKLELEDLDLILRKRRLCWFGHVEGWFGHVECSCGAVRTACDAGGGQEGAKLKWKKLIENDCRELKLTTDDPQERSTWRSGVRSAKHAASQLPGRGPTDEDDILNLHVNQKSKYDMGLNA